ncbi:MAG TPA: D-2-hydroxyacid dehydrogenase [Nitrospinaceae bacterium]|nr:D-2-hydroxyacid dehydrogenase [Nitrospinaceae bacterium]
MNIKKILVYLTHPHVQAWNFLPIHRKLLEDSVPGLNVSICLNLKEFLDRLPEAEIVIVWFFKNDWLEKAINLERIVTPAAGRDWVNLETSKIKVSYGRFHGPMIAESILAAVFYFLKAFHFSKKMQLQKKWARTKISERLGSLKGSRVTILGFGNIGQCVGKFLKSYGCVITGIKRTLVKGPDYFEDGDRVLTVDKISEVLATTDHLVLVLPGGVETQGLLTYELLSKLPANSYVYNVGRGNVYEEQDLVAILQEDKIAGAYLDVFDAEPLSEKSLLWQLDNVLIQPHISAASPQYLELFVEELAEKINNLKEN